MKINKTLISLVPCLSLALSGQAATTNILDWTLSTAPNANQQFAPDPASSSNPSGGNPLATFFNPAGGGYIPGTGPLGLYGPPTGLYDLGGAGAHLSLTLDLGAPGPVDYTLQVFQFSDGVGGVYPGTLTLSPSGASFVSESVYVPQSGSMIGSWYEDTYAWSGVTLSPTVSLDISPGAGGSGALLFDEVRLTIVGELGPVPEPSCGVIMVAGLLAFGARSWLRRKA